MLQISSWLYPVSSDVHQIDKQNILTIFSYEVLFSFFKGNPGEIFQSDLCANKLSSSKQASSLPWIQSPHDTLLLLFLAYACSAGREIYPHKKSSLLQGIILLLETYNEMIIHLCLVSPGDQVYVILQ